MTLFWILAVIALALSAILVLTGARRGAATETGVPVADRGQIAELDSLKARGLIADDAWRSARAEAARRLLADSGRAVLPVAPRAMDARLGLAGAVAAGLAAVATYVVTGAPGMTDQPHSARVTHWATQLDALDPPRLAAVAERVASQSPGDRNAQIFLGRARLDAGDPIGSATAFRRALAMDQNDAVTWSRLGEALVAASEGRVGGDAEAAFRQAVALSPAQPVALYYIGVAALERGDRAGAAAAWAPLLAGLPADDPRAADLRARLEAAQ